jgi:hypothetical protein
LTSNEREWPIAHRYGRAVVSPVLNDTGEEIGLYDLKGAGSRDPSNRAGGHTNGMASVGEGVREFAHEKLFSRLFHVLDSPHRTIGIYAILDLGFQIIDEREITSELASIF